MKQVVNLFTLLKKVLLFHLCLGILLFTIASCKKDVTRFSIGEDFVDSDSRVQLMDTFTVALSTVVFDSIETSNSGLILVGMNNDPVSGETFCQSFFQLGVPASIALEDDEVYDSTTLCISYSGYYYGDTSANMTISVKKLTQDMERPSTGYFYNTSTVLSDDTPIGTRTFTPRPGDLDSILIPIDNAIGLDLFDKMKNSSDIFNTDQGFIKYFNGITIVPDEASSKVILGFIAYGTSTYMQIFSHRTSNPTTVVARRFPLTNQSMQFNKIRSNRSTGPFSAIHSQKNDIPSSQTDNLSMTQGLLGIMTKVRFPSLGELLLLNKTIILKALLVIKPEPGTYTAHNLPDSLLLYTTNRTNRFLSTVYNDDGSLKIGSFVLDGLYNENTSYTWDITDLIKSEFANNYFNDEHGLLISIPQLYVPQSSFYTTFDRVVISGKTFKPELKLYLLSY
jgi:hypothetical protein